MTGYTQFEANMGPRFVAQCDKRRRRFLADPGVTLAQLEELITQVVDVSEAASGESDTLPPHPFESASY